jgi:uncharacterized membrane protein
MSWSLFQQLQLNPSLFNLQVQAQERAINLGDALTLGVGGEKVSSIYNEPADLVNILLPFLFTVAGIILFLLIFYSGFLYIQDTSKGKEEATKIWTTAGIGFIIMFTAYWVIQIISRIIGQPIL